VIVQDAAFGQSSPLVLVVPLTSQATALRFPGTVVVAATPTNGLTLPSVALVFQIRALDRSRFVRRLGEVSDQILDTIFAELDNLTGRAKTP
jgi:mRNA interferase MazF